jgi:uncharacterized protein
MSIEVSPVGVTCNLSCPYCYEHPIREAGNYPEKEYDLYKMISALKKERGSFSLFGGEPLLTDINTLEELWKFGYETYGVNGIQTNGTLITDKHIELFKKYNVSVGVSVDGPDDLNDSRWSGTLDQTRKKTQMTLSAIDNMLQNGIVPSLIVTLTKYNTSNLSKIKSWLKELDKKGVYSVRLHVLEVEYDSIQNSFGLTPEENVSIMLEMANFETELKRMRFDLFKDMKNMLLGDDSNATCTFHSCDPYTTSAVRAVDGQGVSTNCGRTNKEGIDFMKSDTPGYERQIALYHTPQEYGGCSGCRFFLMCKGQCPGTGIKYDWRNKTDLCKMYYTLFEYFEKQFLESGVLPLSLFPGLGSLEKAMISSWIEGRQTYMSEGLRLFDS